jgi:single-strand DNA-binding protein
MFNVNAVMLAGRLGADAEIKTLTNGKVASLSLAVDHNFKDRAGKWHTETSWFRVVTFQPWLIDNVLAPQAGKGRQIFVHGALRARSWEQNGKKQNTVEIEVDHTGGITPITDDTAPMNVVMLAGRLGAHADIKTLPGNAGGKVASFNLAADRSFKDRTGEWRNETDWLRVVTFQPSLIDKVLAKQATKGRLVFIQGALRSREWEQGGEKRTTVEIEVDGAGSITPVVEDKVSKEERHG